MMDFAHSCDDFQRVVKSEIFPDGGSIGLKLESGCKSVHFVKYVKPLRGDEVLSLNGVAVLPGTKDEVLLIQRLDNLVKKAAKNKSLQNFQNAEMKRFVGGGRIRLRRYLLWWKAYAPTIRHGVLMGLFVRNMCQGVN
ncbi:hypothetical protein [Acidovorax sp. sic0104]|uniref:hypothetical protein n=1 Tax=Acidovorax sp. sic0104 TaxID=2854784 RepID=UPI001C44A69E|nr:hypothetical protein [Acidovorax sp. sic0104]MBV7541897.1 hypothetical protein [Acidovorax sp. sic0104]